MNWLHLLNESNIYKKTALLVGSFLYKKSKAIGLLKWSISIGKIFLKKYNNLSLQSKNCHELALILASFNETAFYRLVYFRQKVRL